MITMITSEEYRELVLGEEERDRLLEELKYKEEQLEKAQKTLEELLLMLTKGTGIPKYGDKFESYDIIDDSVIADYINTHFKDKGTLYFVDKENNNE